MSLRPSATYLVLTFVFLVLDHPAQVWWRWMNIFFTLVLWAVELIVSNDEDAVTKSWKVE